MRKKIFVPLLALLSTLMVAAPVQAGGGYSGLSVNFGFVLPLGSHYGYRDRSYHRGYRNYGHRRHVRKDYGHRVFKQYRPHRRVVRRAYRHGYSDGYSQRRTNYSSGRGYNNSHVYRNGHDYQPRRHRGHKRH